jgi:uridine kinase
MSGTTNNLSDINRLAAEDANAFVEACEQRYNTMLGNIAETIPHDDEIMIVMLAGPSSAGKTTTANKLMSRFAEKGKAARRVSLDDFYLEEQRAPLSENGVPDFETVYALDLPLIEKTVRNILSTGESELPLFDFKTHRRGVNPQRLSLKNGDVVIFEGLHALNPVITDMFSQKSLFKLYVSVSTRIYDDEGEVVLSKRDIRLIRRTVRDHKHRSSPVADTFDIWSSVISGENKYLFPFEDRADVKLNSYFPYEPCVIRDEAICVLKELPENSVHYNKCESLIHNLEKFVALPQSLMPRDSLLREFSGS